jgi:uncharacterized protein with PIN domain
MGRSAVKKRERRQAFIGTERTRLNACPHCGAMLDAITGVGFDGAPGAPSIAPGDHTMCCYCYRILMWDGSRHRRVSRAKEAEVFAQSSVLRDFRDILIRKAMEN